MLNTSLESFEDVNDLGSKQQLFSRSGKQTIHKHLQFFNAPSLRNNLDSILNQCEDDMNLISENNQSREQMLAKEMHKIEEEDKQLRR